MQRSFECPSTFRIFACQNPVSQGGGRKGLPKSFLNRFTQVYVDELTSDDLLFITKSLYSQIPEAILHKMIIFNDRLFVDTMVLGLYGKAGSPWEFNLRDITRWCSLMVDSQNEGTWDPSQFVDLIYLQRMRTQQDRDRVIQLYNQIFSSEEGFAGNFRPQQRPFFHVSPHYLQIGSSWLPRNTKHHHDSAMGEAVDLTMISISSEDTEHNASCNSPHILQSSLNVLENMMKCVEKGWMTILTGPTASGKTSLVRLLANLTGNKLREFSMNSSVDTTELLGGFEQIDLQRHKKEILSRISNLLKSVSEMLLLDHCGQDNLNDLQDLHATWSIANARIKFAQQTEGSPDFRGPENYHHTFDVEQYHLLLQLLQKIDNLISRKNWNLSAEMSPSELRSSLERLKTVEKGSVAGCFEWMDGLLIRALEEGDWILIDNVNFCNPTVLDRLNPLLENNGVLMVNERGLVDGEVKVIMPHPNFRIFLAMDPLNGEISRAMRNRGIEISLLPLETVSHDTLLLLNGIGIPGLWLARLMIDFHHCLEKDRIFSGAESSLTVKDLLHWASLTMEQLQRGVPLSQSLAEAMELVYVRHLRNKAHQQAVRVLFNDHLSLLLECLRKGYFVESEGYARLSFLGPSLWPSFVSGKDYCNDSVSSTIKSQGSLFMHQVLQHAGFCLGQELTLLFGQDWYSKTVGHALSAKDMLLKIRESLEANPHLRCSLPIALIQRLYSYASVHPQDAEIFSYVLKDTSDSDDKAMIPVREELLEVSALYILEMASPSDWQNRFCWLKEVGSPTAEKFSSLISSVWDHPLVKLTLDTRMKLENILPPSAQRLLAFQPLDLRTNTPLLSRLWNMLNIQASDDNQEKTTLWAFHINLLHRLDILMTMVSRKDKEAKIYANSERSESIAIQSYLFYQHRLDRSMLRHEVVSLLFPAFEGLDEALEKHLLVGFPHLIDTSYLDELVKQRNYLWDYLNSFTDKNFNLAELQLHWKMFLKQLQFNPSLVDDDEALKSVELNVYCIHKGREVFSVPDSVLSIFTKISDILLSALSGSGKSDKRKKDVLWKNFGRPTLLHTHELFKIWHRLVSLFTPYNNNPQIRLAIPPLSSSPWKTDIFFTDRRKELASLNKLGHWKEGVHDVFLHLDEEFKRHFVEAIVTLYWSDSTGNTTLAAAISQLPQVQYLLFLKICTSCWIC